MSAARRVKVHIDIPPSVRPAADGCSCPLQHHRLRHHDRAFRTFLCASFTSSPACTAHLSVWPQRNEALRNTRGLRCEPGPDPHPNTQQPVLPVLPVLILRLLAPSSSGSSPPAHPQYSSLLHLVVFVQSSLVTCSSCAFLSPVSPSPLPHCPR